MWKLPFPVQIHRHISHETPPDNRQLCCRCVKSIHFLREYTKANRTVSLARKSGRAASRDVPKQSVVPQQSIDNNNSNYQNSMQETCRRLTFEEWWSRECRWCARVLMNAVAACNTVEVLMKISMPATTMFSKFKSSGGTQSPLETNPIGQFFEIGKQIASAGPELIWRIHDAYRKSDGKVSLFYDCCMFNFDQKYYLTDLIYTNVLVVSSITLNVVRILFLLTSLTLNF